MQVNREDLEQIKKSTQDQLGDEVDVSVFVKKKRPKVETYTMFLQVVNGLLVKSLTPASCKVLMYMMSKCTYGNYISKQQDWIAEDCGMSISSVKRACKQLEQLNILLSVPNPEDKRKHDYYLNPTQSWKGQIKERDKVMAYLENNLPSTGKQLNLALEFDDTEK